MNLAVEEFPVAVGGKENVALHQKPFQRAGRRGLRLVRPLVAENDVANGSRWFPRRAPPSSRLAGREDATTAVRSRPQTAGCSPRKRTTRPGVLPNHGHRCGHSAPGTMRSPEPAASRPGGCVPCKMAPLRSTPGHRRCRYTAPRAASAGSTRHRPANGGKADHPSAGASPAGWPGVRASLAAGPLWEAAAA